MFSLFQRQQSLPLLSFTSNLYLEAGLSRTVVIACQHLLGTTVDLFDELFAKGLEPSNTYIIGKCYSTHPKVIKALRKKGVTVSSLSTAYESHRAFDEQFQGYIAQFLRDVKGDLADKSFDQIIILDDGAELLLYANDFFDDFTNIKGVEQTSNGYSKLQKSDLKFSVINIARSKAKLEYESPLIAKLAEQKIRDYIQTNKVINPHILVVGQGYIGEAVHALLKQDHSIRRHDVIAHKSELAHFKKELKNFDIIIGATGETILSAGDFGKLKKNVILISVSSSDREFSSVYLRRLVSETGDCHQNIKFNGITLLNAGFPINFDGSEHSLPREEAQFTRALLLAGVLEALTVKNKENLVDLPSGIQEKIIKKMQSL